MRFKKRSISNGRGVFLCFTTRYIGAPRRNLRPGARRRSRRGPRAIALAMSRAIVRVAAAADAATGFAGGAADGAAASALLVGPRLKSPSTSMI